MKREEMDLIHSVTPEELSAVKNAVEEWGKSQ